MTNEQVDGSTEKISGTGYQACVHLSPLNRRIVIKSYQGPRIDNLTSQLLEKAKKNNFTKIWVKAYQTDKDKFLEADFEKEAVIKNYYPTDNAVSMAYYLTEERKEMINRKQEEKIINNLSTEKSKNTSINLSIDYNFKVAEKEDLKSLADLYDQVFDSYPYPIDNVDYLQQMWSKDVIYGLIYDGQDLVAAASAETVPEEKNAEMTDFATLPSYRGHGLASYLLKELEEVLKEKNYNCLYTIARAKVAGVNKIFSRAGYQYTGRLMQNCNIAGGLEDMNLWCKTI